MKSPKLHRILSFALALCMLCTMLSGLSLTAFADDTYTVTFSVPTGFVAPNPVTVVAGTSFQLETVGAPAGYTFVGWYANPIWNEISLQNESSIYTSLYKPTADITLFACYKRSETIPGYYEKTTGEPSSSATKYLFVYEGADKNLAFNASKGTAASHFNVKGNYIEVSIADEQIQLTQEVEAAAVLIRRTANATSTQPAQFSIQLPNEKYFGINSPSKTDIKLYDTPYANSLRIDELGYVIVSDTSATSGRVFCYSTKVAEDSFKFYKYDANLYLYQKISPRIVTYYTTNPLGETPCVHQNYTWVGAVPATCTTAGHTGTKVCDDCGATLQADTEIPALGHNYSTFSSNNNGTHSKTCSRCGDVVTEACAYTSSTAGNTTTYTCTVCNYSYQEQSVPTVCSHNFVDNVCTLCGERFRIRSATLSLNNQIDVVYICEIPTGFTNVSLNVNGTAITDYEESGGYCYFFYTGITPQCMGDNLSATLTGSYGGQTLTATKATYSVRQYCVNRLKDSSTSDELRALVTALLSYGTRAQAYMGYNTNTYVASGDDIVNPINTSFTALSGYDAGFEGDADAETYWISAGLTLTNGVAMNFRFYTAHASDLTIYITKDGATKIYTAIDFTAVSGEANVYEITFDGINADEFAKTVTAAFERDDDQVGSRLSYSVNAYIQSKQNASPNKLKNLVRALSVYGACVEAYKASLAN